MTEPKASNFWSTLPGPVTAIAGMITAIAILVSARDNPGIAATTANAPTGSPGSSAAAASATADASETSAESPSDAGLPGPPMPSVAPTELPLLF